jgi:multimeric flavodoxin WrbA
MNILTLLGSPRRKGNTAAVLSAFEKLAAENHSIERIDVVTKHIKGCIGCDNCLKDSANPGCIHKDDLNTVLEKVIAADVVIYAAPVYVWDFPAQMKALIDRHYCLLKWKEEQNKSLVEQKKTMLMVTCGGDAENNADLIRQIYRREMDYLHCKILGEFVVPNTTVPSELGTIKDDIAAQMNEVLEQI